VTDDQLITFILNGDTVSRRVAPRVHLADFLRQELALTGTHVGCEHGVCGACTVRLDGLIVRACLLLAVQVDASEVETIEGLAGNRTLQLLQKAFHARNALQCGFCTPGMLLTAQELLQHNPTPSREQIRSHISGNYCRCTGYHAIVDAVAAAAAQLASAGAAK
jgi:aerobic carbon-monoxide dehydrogenase small subunit